MPTDTVKLHLDGTVSLALFADALEHFRGLLDALSGEVGHGDPIDWVVEELAAGSATTVVRGSAARMNNVEVVCRAVISVGRSLQHQQRSDYGEKVRGEARSLQGLLNGRIASMTFETPEEETTIYSGSDLPIAAPVALRAYGVIEGRVEMLSRRGGLRFSLYDTLDDRAISCYLQEGLQDKMREAWGNRALVEGLISRDPFTGRPMNIRRVSNVTLVPEVAKGSYRQARGVLPLGPDDLLPEEAIRRVRDGR